MSQIDPLVVPESKSPFRWILGGMGCLGIVAVMVYALLLPVFNQVETSTQTRLCMTNLKSIGAAMILYAEENNDKIPEKGTWMDRFLTYVDSDVNFACPVQRRMDPRTYGYALSKVLPGQSLSKIEEPEKKEAVFDSNRIERNAESDLTSLPDPGRHSNGRKNTVLFLDGRTDSIGRM
ncbi:MAG TPA: hypothetical protein PKA27_07720 [Fimbriimonadaceae bacterium]|nr:hypothetical protein [Fimbriimonadaceae bacterium]